MSDFQFPTDPPRFVAVPSAGRGRVILVSEPLNPAPTAVQVATAPADVDVKHLVEVLNRTAWTGDEAELATVLKALPGDVAQSCRDAIAAVPPSASVALSDDELPVQVIREFWTSLRAPDITEAADAAVTLGLQLLITNKLDDDLGVELHARLLSADRESTTREGTWWPLPDGRSVIGRVSATTNFAELFDDPRWETNHARAFWGWVADDETMHTATWTVEFLDTPLEPDRNFRIFVTADEGSDDEELGVMSPRNRFVLWLALSEIAADLDGAVALPPWDPERCLTCAGMPQITRGQPIEWWRRMGISATELEEAARTGDLARLEPQTIAEEALIALATRRAWIDMAFDRIEDEGYRDAYEALPHGGMDGEFREILPELTGDTDIELLWTPRFDGIEDPSELANTILGIGDYRPTAWHEPFNRAT